MLVVDASMTLDVSDAVTLINAVKSDPAVEQAIKQGVASVLPGVDDHMIESIELSLARRLSSVERRLQGYVRCDYRISLPVEQAADSGFAAWVIPQHEGEFAASINAALQSTSASATVEVHRAFESQVAAAVEWRGIGSVTTEAIPTQGGLPPSPWAGGKEESASSASAGVIGGVGAAALLLTLLCLFLLRGRFAKLRSMQLGSKILGSAGSWTSRFTNIGAVVPASHPSGHDVSAGYSSSDQSPEQSDEDIEVCVGYPEDSPTWRSQRREADDDPLASVAAASDASGVAPGSSSCAAVAEGSADDLEQTNPAGTATSALPPAVVAGGAALPDELVGIRSTGSVDDGTPEINAAALGADVVPADSPVRSLADSAARVRAISLGALEGAFIPPDSPVENTRQEARVQCSWGGRLARGNKMVVSLDGDGEVEAWTRPGTAPPRQPSPSSALGGCAVSETQTGGGHAPAPKSSCSLRVEL